MPVIERSASGLKELVEEVLHIKNGLGSDRFMWFRGDCSSSFDLKPKIMRGQSDIAKVFDREKRLLTRFRQRSLAYWPAGYPQDSWEHLFAMQHYGMPTRLLDWSENLFVAAYFALNYSPPSEYDQRPVIWCLDPVSWNRKVPPLTEFGDSVHVLTTVDEEVDSYSPTTAKRRNRTPVAIYGSHNSDRIVAQRGTFFVWGNEIKSLQDVSNEIGCDIWKIVLEQDVVSLRADLISLGFGETMIFPELSYLAEELTRSEGWSNV